MPTADPSLSPVILEDGLTRLAIAPAIGGSLAGWWRRSDDLPLMRSHAGALDGCAPRDLAQYPLVPWSNRIDQGGYATPRGWQELAPNTAHPVHATHGSAWQQPWDVVARGKRHVRLRLVSRTPFAYTAEQLIRLRGGRLDIQMQVWHDDPAPNWHGLGLHPYFPRTPATRLHMVTREVWDGAADTLPTQRIAVPEAWDFAQTRALPDTLVDHAFEGWDGHCRIEQADHGYALLGRATGSHRVVLFCPVGRDVFCVEPVTHPVNAHHLPGRPGLRLRYQGQSVRLRWQLRYVAL